MLHWDRNHTNHTYNTKDIRGEMGEVFCNLLRVCRTQVCPRASVVSSTSILEKCKLQTSHFYLLIYIFV